MCSYIEEVNNKTEKSVDDIRRQKILRFNKYGLYLVVVAILSASIASAFRTTEHLEIHLFAVSPLFIALVGTVHIQTWISLQLMPNVVSHSTARFRLIVLIIDYLVIVVGSIATIIALIQMKVPYSQLRSSGRFWDESWGGYHAHAISAIAENILVLMFCPWYASFVAGFNRIRSKNGRLEYEFFN